MAFLWKLSLFKDKVNKVKGFIITNGMDSWAKATDLSTIRHNATQHNKRRDKDKATLLRLREL